MAASLPMPPIAIPASERANTGASFIPSPTKITEAFLFFAFTSSEISSNLETFSWGKSIEV